jgi:hypothetical protein
MKTIVAALLVFFAFSQPVRGQAATQSSELAAVRLAHFSNDAPLLDLLLDGKLRLRDLNFTEVSAYLILPAGEHELRVQPHRAPASGDTTQTDVQAPEPFIISVTLEPGQYYTVVASGFFDPPPSEGELGTLTLNMTEGTTATLTGPRAFGATVTETSELTDLFPGTYTVTATREGFKTTQYEVQVRPNETAVLSVTLQANGEGETSEAPAPVVTEQTNPGLEWRKVQLQLYEDELTGFPPAGSAYVRFIHASPIAPSVSITLARRGQENETTETIVGDLSYPNKTEYAAVVAGRMKFQARDASSNDILTELENLELQAGAMYTFYILGTRDDSFVSVIPTIDAVLAGQP